MHTPAEHLGDATEQEPEPFAIEVVEKDVDATDPAHGDMEDAILGKVRSRRARHVAIDRSRTSSQGLGPPRQESHFCYRDCP
jgi:hypothetical protein